jgi:formylglycine-generating enzyme required for sulfatase activity
MVAEGRFANDDAVERWRSWLLLDDASFEAALDARWQPQRETEPRFWRDHRFNHPAQPVVGITWYEARAYCAWLGAQSGLAVRLPTEVESEAAARGLSGRRHPEGDEPGVLSANTFEVHLKQTSPVGVFPDGRTPEGVDDLAGNVYEWTSSLFGSSGVGDDEAEFQYPYVASDGRENPDAPPNVRRVLRGGAWANAFSNGRAVSRNCDPPTNRLNFYGLRIVVTDGDAPSMNGGRNR